MPNLPCRQSMPSHMAEGAAAHFFACRTFCPCMRFSVVWVRYAFVHFQIPRGQKRIAFAPILREPQCKKRPAKGVPAQESIGFGQTILPPGAFKKPGNPSRITGLFHAAVRPKLPGRPLAAKSTAAIASRTDSLLKSSAGTFAAMGSRKTASHL